MEQNQKLIYDRSLADVQRVAELNRKISAGSASAEEVQEWFNSKGALNYTDLNRIETWTEFLANYLHTFGYNAQIEKRAEQTYYPTGKPVARLPKEYQEVECIESHGAEYIGTGISSTNDTVIDAKMAATSSDNSVFFGTTYSSFAWKDILCFFTTSGNIEMGASATYCRTSATLNTVYDIHYETALANCRVNGSALQLSGGSSVTTLGNQILVSAGNGKFGHNIIEKFSIAQGGVLVRDYIPCYRKSDGVAGLYCLVTNTLYTNAGSGAFSVGPDVSPETIYPEAELITYYDWRVWDIPTPSELQRIINNVNSIREGFYSLSNWRDITYKSNIRFEDINSIEWNLASIYAWLDLMVKNFIYSGEMYAGEAW